MMDYSKATCNFPNNHLSCNMSTSENLHSETKSEETSPLSNFLKKKKKRERKQSTCTSHRLGERRRLGEAHLGVFTSVVLIVVQ
jgi:hypothetical protein